MQHILFYYLPQVQHALQKTDRALSTLQQAIDAAPQNPLCKYEKATILLSCERYDEALLELNELKALAPKESAVYFMVKIPLLLLIPAWKLCLFSDTVKSFRSCVRGASAKNYLLNNFFLIWNSTSLTLSNTFFIVSLSISTFQIGKVHNKLNNTHLALMHFSWAMDLDPKVANSQIKDAMDPTLNRMSQEDSTVSAAAVDEQLVIEDIEVGAVEPAEDDAVMMEGNISSVVT